MTAGNYDFTLEQGTTFTKSFVWKDSNNAVINLSGYSARLQIRAYKDSVTKLVEATTQNGKLVITANLGKIALTLPPADTNGITFEQGLYDLEVEASNGVVTRLLEGIVTFSKQVTR